MSLTAEEQYLLELINRARLDPLGEVARYGVDLNEGLEPGTISGDALQVLAQNDLLSDAAEAHSAWMLQADTFSHTGDNGSSAGQRMEEANYEFTGDWSWRENLAWAGTTGTIDMADAIDSHYEGLYRSAGHRANTFASGVTEIGIGQVRGSFDQNGASYDSSMLTENFAASGGDHFVTGVAYRDTDKDDFYSIGEGQGDVWFRMAGDQTMTASAGGYSLNAGGLDEVRVTLGEGSTTYATLDVDLSDGNAKVDLVTDANGSQYLVLSASTDMISGITAANLVGVGDIDLRGTAGRDVLNGNAGDNRIHGEARGDNIHGGDGDDHLSGGDGWDVIRGGKGNDRIWGGNDNDILKGGKGDDRMVGGSGNDRLSGEDGDDTMWTGTGHDKAWGGSGKDVIKGGQSGDMLYGNSGEDRLYGEHGWDKLYGGSQDDSIWGGAGDDLIKGDTGNDYLNGGQDDDQLFGWTGNDRLDGAKGDDKLTGGSGADTFIFKAGNDQVMDFENNIDSIAIGSNIAGDMTKADVLALGEMVDGNAVFDFGDGNVLTIHDVAGIGYLDNDLYIM